VSKKLDLGRQLFSVEDSHGMNGWEIMEQLKMILNFIIELNQMFSLISHAAASTDIPYHREMNLIMGFPDEIYNKLVEYMLPLNPDGSKPNLDDERYSDSITGLFYGPLSRLDLSTLQEGQNISKYIVDQSMAIISSRELANAASVTKSVFFPSGTLQKIMSKTQLETIIFPLNSFLLYLPFQDSSLRWMTIVIDLRAKCIHFFNFEKANNDIMQYQHEILQWLEFLYKDTENGFILTDWRSQSNKDPTYISNSIINSGPYVIMCINFMSVKLPLIKFESDLMGSFRKAIGVSILTNTFRTAAPGFQRYPNELVDIASSMLNLTGTN
jgi:hypothetical protein